MGTKMRQTFADVAKDTMTVETDPDQGVVLLTVQSGSDAAGAFLLSERDAFKVQEMLCAWLGERMCRRASASKRRRARKS